MARVHHFATTTMCPLGGRLVMGEGSLFERAKLVCHCLLVETQAGLVLVDTGLYATTDFESRRVDVVTEWNLGASLVRSELAKSQVEALGYSASDVRHVIPTHLDLDHAGGIADFPHAAVHVMEREHAAAIARARFLEKNRYIPRHIEGVRFVRHEVDGETWKGFASVRPLPGAGDDVLLVPLYGHTRGHAAVAVKKDDGTWVLHCGDAYFSKQEIVTEEDAPPLLEFFQRVVAIDDDLRRKNRDRLRSLVKEHEGVRVFSAHSAVELEELKSDP
ncbi:MBL fold metallo-hydrolase [soil metagenome]